MGIYDKYKKIVLPLTSVKTQVTTALPGVIGRTVTTGLGNEGIDLAIWINEKLQDDTIEIPGLAELIQLTGMPEGSTTLGSFNGNIIPDNSTIKQALQILETAVMGAGGGSGLNGIYTGSGDIASNVVANVTDSFSINTSQSGQSIKIGDINNAILSNITSTTGFGLLLNSGQKLKLGAVFQSGSNYPFIEISKLETSIKQDSNNYLRFPASANAELRTDKLKVLISTPYASTFQGLTYELDYSNNYTPRSLVDKAYVDLKSQIVADGDKGDITISNNGTVWLVNNSVLTYNKLQNTTGSKLLGRYDSTTGTIQEIALGTGLAFVNNTLVSTGGSGGILLTTNNSSGPATLNSGILNIPNYSLTGLGGVPTTRTITINGETYDLSQNRSWNITSMIYPSAGIPISTGTGWGTSITNNSTNWNTAYSWGNHATQGYLTSVNLNALTDVTIGTLNNGQILQYNGTTSQWENVSVTIGSGDMQKSVYDIDNDGVVDYAETISVTVRNTSNTDILRRGTIVYLSGSTGNRPNAFKAQANSESTSSGTFGVVVNDINTNGDGLVAAMGTLHNLDTRTGANGNPNPFTSDTLLDGDILWLDPTTAGYVTKTKPSAPNHAVFIGIVAATSPTSGRIVYKIQNGYEIEELHNVKITSPLVNNQVLRYNDSNSLWENKTLNFQTPLILTTNGTSGAATLAGDGTLNIPNYSTAPGGSNTEVQFNNSGVFGGSSKFTWSNDILSLNTLTSSISPILQLSSYFNASGNNGKIGTRIYNVGQDLAPNRSMTTLNFDVASEPMTNWQTAMSLVSEFDINDNLQNVTLSVNGGLSLTNIPLITTDATNVLGVTSSGGLGKLSLDSSTLSLSSAGVLSGVIKTLNDLTDVVVSSPTSGQVLSYNGTNWVNTTGGGGGGTPGGSTTQVQFNDAGSFGGASGFTYDKTAFTNTGQLNIGSPSSPTGRLNVKGGGNDSTTVNTRLTNSADTELLKVLDNGSTNIGTAFNWDNVNGRLGIGTAAPGTSIETTGAIRLSGTGTQPLEAPNATLFPVRCISGSIALRSSSGGGVSVSSSDLTPSARLHVRGSDDLSTSSAFLVQNNATTPLTLLDIRNNGDFSLGANFVFDRANNRLSIGNPTSPAATVNIRGAGNGSSNSLSIQNSDSKSTFRIRDNGIVVFGNNTSTFWFPFATTVGTANVDGVNQSLFLGGTSQAATFGRLHIGGEAHTQTSGDVSHMYLYDQFSPTSGTATASTLRFNTQINQTGGANGITRGIYLTPLLTSAADWRTIEWNNNSGYGLYGVGTANNYLAGNLGLGTTAPAHLLHVAGTARIDGNNVITDNRNNGFLTQSASSNTSNRESVWGNGGYAKLRAHTKGFYVGASFPAVNYLFYVDGGTATGVLDREGIYIRPTQPAAGGNTNGGDVIIELPAGTGTGRRGEVLIGTATATGPSAIVEISSTNQGLLLPRMTGAQAEAIPTPADGLLVYANNGNGAVITSVGFWGYSAGAWSKLN